MIRENEPVKDYTQKNSFHCGESFDVACPKCGQRSRIPVEWSNTTCGQCPGVSLLPKEAPGGRRPLPSMQVPSVHPEKD